VSLNASWDGDVIHVAAPELHFIAGKPLERLRNGLSVVYLSQLSLLTDDRSNVFRRSPDRLVVSYDLWEEKFSVTRLGGGSRSASNLSAQAAEQWAVASLGISASGIAPTRPFWLRLELRLADPKEVGSLVGDSGLSLSRLVEIFSRRPAAQSPSWSVDAGPMRLADLKRVPGRNG
jgi:hypothetical protein